MTKEQQRRQENTASGSCQPGKKSDAGSRTDRGWDRGRLEVGRIALAKKQTRG